MKKIFLSLILPCFNESENLKRGVLAEVNEFLKNQNFTWEVIISDDGSTDESLLLVETFIKNHPKFSLLKNPHGGKPEAVRQGILASGGEIVLFADMDQSTPIGELTKLLPYFDQGYEVVIGSRGRKRKNFPFYRLLASNIFLLLRRMIILRKISDTQCGFKSLKKEAALKIFSKMEIFKKKGEMSGWRVTAFDVEMLFLAEKLGYKIAEVEVDWVDRDISRGKKKNFLKESTEMFKEILRVRRNDWRGGYG